MLTLDAKSGKHDSVPPILCHYQTYGPLAHIGDQIRQLPQSIKSEADSNPTSAMTAQLNAAGKLLAEAMDKGAWGWSTLLVNLRQQAMASADAQYAAFWILAWNTWLPVLDAAHRARADINGQPWDQAFANSCRIFADLIVSEAKRLEEDLPFTEPHELDLADVLCGDGGEETPAGSELACRLTELANDLKSGPHISNQIRYNAHDLVRPVRLSLRNVSMFRLKLATGESTWAKRDVLKLTPDERRLAHNLCQVLIALCNLWQGRNGAESSQDLERAANSIKLLSGGTDIEQPLQSDSQAGRATATKVTWKKAMMRAEHHCARNPFPGVNALAKLCGCSAATMSKAVRKSAILRPMLDAQKDNRQTLRTVPLDDRISRSVAQQREPNPVDEAAASTDGALQRILDISKPAERDKILAMSPERQAELVAELENDPERQRPERVSKR